MNWEDVRRITGRHPLIAVAGVGAELVEPSTPGDVDAELQRVLGRLGEAYRALGWPPPVTSTRLHGAGASLACTAPADQLYAAADALEWATEHDDMPLERLRAAAAEEDRPHLRAWLTSRSGRSVFYDDDEFSLGLGKHGRTWPIADVPSPDAALADLADVPFVYVTGTNGKTTTTRLFARICLEAGFTPGHTSSDGVVVAGEWVTRGDWTGPGAARHVLRHPEVDFAVLETARGGLMRRGLVLDGAVAAVVTNISDDHLGEWGLLDLDDMAWAKLTVAHAVRPGGTLVVSTDGGALDRGTAAVRATRPDLQVRVVSDGPARPELDGWFEDGALWIRWQGEPVRLVAADDVPITLRGAARHNVQNALSATWLALGAGISREAIVAGLRAFRPTLKESRGRLNRFEMPGGGTVIVDFAHNPEAVSRLAPIAEAWRPGKISLTTGQAGDRSDALLERLVDAIAEVRPDRVLLKELPKYLRGREPGAVRALLRAGLEAHGFPPSHLEDFELEIDAAKRAIDTLTPGDLALLVVHEDVDAVVALLLEHGAVEQAD